MPFRDPRELPFAPVKWSGALPHLYKPGCTYFITARLADAVIPWPERMREPTEEEVDPEELMRGIDPPLRLGACELGIHEVAGFVRDALLHYARERFELRAWCIMPNHVHLVMETFGEWTPDVILRDWKGYTARGVNRMLGRKGPWWERESFDHLVRTETGLVKFILYTQRNPVAAGLCRREEDWPFVSHARVDRVG